MNKLPSYIGLVQGKCQPTDIDGVRIIDDKLILLEVKKDRKKVLYGQRLALERIARRWSDNGGISYVLYMSHRTSSRESIKPSDLRLFEYTKDGVSHIPDKMNWDLNMVIDKIINDNI